MRDGQGTTEEERAIEQVLGGDPGALDRWFRAEHPTVWRLCFGFVADLADADDLAQDAMLRLHDRLSQWDPARPYRQWRNSVVLNLCRDRRRRRDARQRAEARAAEGTPPPHLPDPSQPLAQRELRERLAAALEVLTPREREAFVLRELEGHSTPEAAELLGIGESSLRSLLTLARRRLRDFLGSHFAELAGGDHA